MVTWCARSAPPAAPGVLDSGAPGGQSTQAAMLRRRIGEIHIGVSRLTLVSEMIDQKSLYRAPQTYVHGKVICTAGLSKPAPLTDLSVLLVFLLRGIGFIPLVGC